MIIVNCAQGSEAWYQERAGVITANMFGDARARLKSGPNKGEPTEGFGLRIPPCRRAYRRQAAG